MNKKHDNLKASLNDVTKDNKKHDTLKATLNDVTKVVARLEGPDCISPSSNMPLDMVPLKQPLGPSPQASNIPINSSIAANNKRNVGGFKHSSRNLKRVARMPAKDRLEILKILKKQARDQRARFLSHSSKAKRAAKSQGSKTNSDSSISSVNKEWEHWVSLQGGHKATAEDVCGIGGLIGVKYKGDMMNRFNVLSKEGREGP